MDMDAEMDMEPAGDEMEMDAMADEGEPMDVGDVSIDTDMDGDVDFTGNIMATSDMEPEMDGMEEPMDDMGAEDDLELEEIIRELEDEMEEGMHEDEMEETMYEGMHEDEMEEGMHEDEMEESIDELIEAILAEEEDVDEDMQKEKEEKVDEMAHGDKEKADEEKEETLEELKEAYKTVSHLKSVINEVNLLNAKLLYTNKLFRNFDLNEGQKMKLIENFAWSSCCNRSRC
jgi:hypothetical protein